MMEKQGYFVVSELPSTSTSGKLNARWNLSPEYMSSLSDRGGGASLV